MSDTPRTDEEAFRPCAGCVDDKVEVVSAVFARTLEREIAAKQAIIDRLMLEHCPEEMTEDQVAEWGRHQKPA